MCSLSPPPPRASLGEGAAAALAGRRRENAPFCAVVMTCVVERGRSARTLGASGSNAGAHDPERTVSGRTDMGSWCGSAGNSARHMLNQTRPPEPSPAGCCPWTDGARVEAPRGSPPWSLASSPLSIRPGYGSGALPSPSCVTLGKLLNLSEPLLPHLPNGIVREGHSFIRQSSMERPRGIQVSPKNPGGKPTFTMPHEAWPTEALRWAMCTAIVIYQFATR